MCNHVFTNDRKIRIYRRKITVQIVTVGPTSLIISTFSALECMTFITKMKFYLLIKIRLQLSIKLNQDQKINKPEYIKPKTKTD